MPLLFGRKLKRKDLERRGGSMEQFASVTLCTFEDGWQRGMRYLLFKNAGGLSFQVMLDRAMDIGEAEFKGFPIGWHSPTGCKHPKFHEHESENGLAWLRSFSGLMMTCGLDHILGPEQEDMSHFHYPHQTQRKSPVHGRIAFSPAKLIGYGAKWQGDDYILWCEGQVQQTSVFGEQLQLTRKIECTLGSHNISIVDEVENMGFDPTPHMMMYHINLCYPILDENSQYIAPIKECIWAGHAPDKQGIAYNPQSPPMAKLQEQVYEHLVVADASGKVPLALVNKALNNNQGLGIGIEYDKSALPCLLQWQCFQEGLYAFGVEPSTNHVLGKQYAKDNNQLQWLAHGQSKTYSLNISVLDGKQTIAEYEKRIHDIIKQPSEAYPKPTENWHLTKENHE